MKLEETQLDGSLWQGGDSAHGIIPHGDVAATIAAAAYENFRRFSRGGLEIGGVLLGKRTEGVLSVERWTPIECEHARGPALFLSERDEHALARNLAEARHSGLKVVGWFVSHSRSALALSDSDLEVFNRFFSEPWQVTLVIKPGMDASVRARICSRHPSGVVFGPEFRFDTTSGAPVKGPLRRQEKSLTATTGQEACPTGNVPVHRVRATGQEAYATQAPKFVVAKQAAGSTRWVIVVLGTLCLLLAALVFAGNLSVLLPRSAPKLGLRAIDTGDQLRVEWNAESPLVQEAQHATVEVNDGGKSTKLLLNTNHLRMGSFQYVRQSNDVEFVFTVHRANQPPVQEWTRFIGPSTADPTAVESTPETSTRGQSVPDRIRELEDENKRLNAALQAETAKRVQLEQAVRILRQHVGFKSN